MEETDRDLKQYNSGNEDDLSDEDKKWIEENLQYDECSFVSGNDSSKLSTNSKLNERKLTIIRELNSYNYKTPIFKIALALEELFKECNSYKYHWAKIAQYYTPKSINSVLRKMNKAHDTDWKTIENPAAYFTSAIKYHKKRKMFRNTNDTYKPKNYEKC